MPASRSLRRDLALGFGAGILLVWFIALLAGWMALREEVDEIYDAALGRTAERLLILGVNRLTDDIVREISAFAAEATGLLLLPDPSQVCPSATHVPSR